MLTIYLQRVRAPHGMTLKAYSSFYSKLVKKHKNSNNLKIISRSSYYSDGGYWLIERRLETDAELSKRQAILDKREALRKADMLRLQVKRKADRAKWKAVEKAKKAAEVKAKMEKKVEEVKTMVKILKAAGFNVSKTAVVSATGN